MGEKKDCPLSAPEWVNYLQNWKSHVITIAFSKILFFITSFGILGSLFYFARITDNISNNLIPGRINIAISYIIIFVAILMIMLFICWVIISTAIRLNNDMKKASEMIKKIIEGENDSNKIKEEWLKNFEKRRKKMFKDISIFVWKEIRTIAITAGIGIFVIGLILMIFGKEFFPITYSQWLTSFGLAIFVLGVAFHSIVISKISSKEITAIANATFLELADMFEDKRIQLLQHPDWLGFEGTIWKSRTYVKRAMKLMKYAEIDNENQTELAEQYIKLRYHTGVQWGNKIIKKKDIKNMIKNCSSLLDFDLDSKKKEELKEIYNYFEKVKKKK